MILLIDERLPWPDAVWSLSERARQDHLTARCYRVAFDDDGRCSFKPNALIRQQDQPPLEEFLKRHRQQVETLDIALFHYANDASLFQTGRQIWELAANTLSIRLIGFVLSTGVSSESWQSFSHTYSDTIRNPHNSQDRRIFDSIFLPTSLNERGEPVPPSEILACGEHLFHSAMVLGSEVFDAIGAFSGGPDEPWLIGCGMRSWAPTASECLRLAKDVLPLLINRAAQNSKADVKSTVDFIGLLNSHSNQLPYDSSGELWTRSLPDAGSLTGRAAILRILGLPEDFDDLSDRDQLASCEADLLYQPQCFGEKAGAVFSHVTSRIEDLVREHRRSLKQLSGQIRGLCLERLTHAEIEFAKTLVAPGTPEVILSATESIDLSIPKNEISPCPQLNEPTPSAIRTDLKDAFEQCGDSLRKKKSAGATGALNTFFQAVAKWFYVRLIAPVYAFGIFLFSIGLLTGIGLLINPLFSFVSLPPDLPWTRLGAGFSILSALLIVMALVGMRLADQQLRLFQDMRENLERCLSDNLRVVQQCLTHPVDRLIQRETLLFSRLFADSAGPTVATLRRIMGIFISHGSISVEGQRLLGQLDEEVRRHLNAEIDDLVEQLLAGFRDGKPAEQIEATLESGFLRIGAKILDLGIRDHRQVSEHAIQKELDENGPPVWAPFDHGEMNVGVSRLAIVQAGSSVREYFPPTVPDGRYEKQTILEIPQETCIPALLVKSKRLVTPEQFRQLYIQAENFNQQ